VVGLVVDLAAGVVLELLDLVKTARFLNVGGKLVGHADLLGECLSLAIVKAKKAKKKKKKKRKEKFNTTTVRK